MNIKLRYISAALLALSCGAANAITVVAVQTSSGPMTTTPNTCTVTFDGPVLCPDVTYSADTASHIVSGSNPGYYYAPPNDGTNFLTVGTPGIPGDVTISIAGSGDTYFGFYAGTIDSFNSIKFSNGADSLTLSGNDISNYLTGSSANGSGTGYFNIFTNSAFTSITLSSSQAAFETDNHSFGIASPVPEPESIALLGIGLVALGAAKRRRAK